MVHVKNFSEELERDLQRLNIEVDIHKQETGNELLTSRELVKKSLERIAEKVPESIPVSKEPLPVITVMPSAPVGTLPNYLDKGEYTEELKQEVSDLVSLVFSSSIETAIKESKHHSPFVQDAFHDALVDKLMPELQKRGIVT